MKAGPAGLKTAYLLLASCQTERIASAFAAAGGARAAADAIEQRLLHANSHNTSTAA